MFGGNCGPGYYPDNPNNYPDNRPNYPNNRPNYPDTDPLYNDQDRGCARIWRGQRRFSSFAARESLSARDVRECEKFCRYETECNPFLEFWVFITMVDDHSYRPPCTQKVNCKFDCSLSLMSQFLFFRTSNQYVCRSFSYSSANAYISYNSKNCQLSDLREQEFRNGDMETDYNSDIFILTESGACGGGYPSSSSFISMRMLESRPPLFFNLTHIGDNLKIRDP